MTKIMMDIIFDLLLGIDLKVWWSEYHRDFFSILFMNTRKIDTVEHFKRISRKRFDIAAQIEARHLLFQSDRKYYYDDKKAFTHASFMHCFSFLGVDPSLSVQ
jgi:hypothetical protein